MAGTTKLMTAGGGGVNLTPASSIASDVTVNIPSQNCTLGIQGPAFSAYATSNQTISTSTGTKVQINAKTFDTNSNFDTTLYRFTPTVAGYYQLTGSGGWAAQNAYSQVQLLKNGVLYAVGANTATASMSITSVSALVYLNGTTDYVELYCAQYSGVNQTLNSGATTTFFQGCLVRAA